MQTAREIQILDISAVVLGQKDTVHPVLIRDRETAVLVDTGFPRQIHSLREAIRQAGTSLEQLQHIIITHQDIDHIGNLPDLTSAAPSKPQVLAHELEKPYIQGERRLLKVTPEALAQIDALPEEVPLEWRRSLKALLENPPKAQVDRTIADGELLPYGGGIRVIATPGHTPGHISLYHEASRTLIAGDALKVTDGSLQGPAPQETLNMEQALQSLAKLAAYDIHTVICYHGGLYQGEANARIAELARGSGL
ncbi:MBL fold metallo-hydrolase [Paenibacillus doosanensis]|uniref:Metallo-hydrolase YflN n=1 Tax=Paenibacillus konkukensis TaxID=2020716 RepID=A0ABY4RUV3_9BACL|nr:MULTISPECIES: MBL fold metallo-hydrolase [Paenibacillus]MCS7464969.1 MBL fold metallo-hydrolase [Paenibacillus doosanensis]UQZ86386.1 putative metallo-hydrolase YflN [Paenibacillus konkukensis]